MKPRWTLRPAARVVAGLAVASAAALAATPDAAGAQASPYATIVLVRHAERAPEPADDPGLTEAGERRAETLARMLSGAGVSSVYSTQFARTRRTAEPLARSVGVDVTVVEAVRGGDHVREMADRLRAHGAGDVVVVVGHSNTVPAIAEALGAGPAPAIAEDEYDNVFLVTLDPGSGKAGLTVLKFGF